MQVDNEVELAAADVFDDVKNPQNRQWFESVAQRHAIDGDHFVGMTRQLDNLRAGLSGGDGDTGVRKLLANGLQRRQTHHHVAKLAEVDYENVARIQCHYQSAGCFPALLQMLIKKLHARVICAQPIFVQQKIVNLVRENKLFKIDVVGA